MEMKERPILFSAPMVNAILEGRKTQTRRLFKPFGKTTFKDKLRLLCLKIGVYDAWKPYKYEGPYGKPGDRLWVRETFRPSERGIEDDPGYENGIEYRADNAFLAKPASTLKDDFTYRWKPSIFMPRWASRINLEITDIRMDRLKNINEADVRAEGVQVMGYGDYPSEFSGKHLFKELWDSINDKPVKGVRYDWNANPWVWVIEFKRVEDTN